MNWSSWEQFWAMGGHGFFVWGSYAVTAVLMLGEVWLVAGRLRQARAAVRHQTEDEGNA